MSTNSYFKCYVNPNIIVVPRVNLIPCNENNDSAANTSLPAREQTAADNRSTESQDNNIVIDGENANNYIPINQYNPIEINSQHEIQKPNSKYSYHNNLVDLTAFRDETKTSSDYNIPALSNVSGKIKEQVLAEQDKLTSVILQPLVSTIQPDSSDEIELKYLFKNKPRHASHANEFRNVVVYDAKSTYNNEQVLAEQDKLSSVILQPSVSTIQPDSFDEIEDNLKYLHKVKTKPIRHVSHPNEFGNVVVYDAKSTFDENIKDIDNIKKTSQQKYKEQNYNTLSETQKSNLSSGALQRYLAYQRFIRNYYESEETNIKKEATSRKVENLQLTNKINKQFQHKQKSKDSTLKITKQIRTREMSKETVLSPKYENKKRYKQQKYSTDHDKMKKSSGAHRVQEKSESKGKVTKHLEREKLKKEKSKCVEIMKASKLKELKYEEQQISKHESKINKKSQEACTTKEKDTKIHGYLVNKNNKKLKEKQSSEVRKENMTELKEKHDNSTERRIKVEQKKLLKCLKLRKKKEESKLRLMRYLERRKRQEESNQKDLEEKEKNIKFASYVVPKKGRNMEHIEKPKHCSDLMQLELDNEPPKYKRIKNFERIKAKENSESVKSSYCYTGDKVDSSIMTESRNATPVVSTGDMNDKPILMENNIDDLRTLLSRKRKSQSHIESKRSKRDNLVITVKQDINNKLEAANMPLKSSKPKVKKSKNIKLVINIVCPSSPDHSDDLDQTVSEASTSPIQDMSFLDDFDIDEIVDSLNVTSNISSKDFNNCNDNKPNKLKGQQIDTTTNLEHKDLAPYFQERKKPESKEGVLTKTGRDSDRCQMENVNIKNDCTTASADKLDAKIQIVSKQHYNDDVYEVIDITNDDDDDKSHIILLEDDVADIEPSNYHDEIELKLALLTESDINQEPETLSIVSNSINVIEKENNKFVDNKNRETLDKVESNVDFKQRELNIKCIEKNFVAETVSTLPEISKSKNSNTFFVTTLNKPCNDELYIIADNQNSQINSKGSDTNKYNDGLKLLNAKPSDLKPRNDNDGNLSNTILSNLRDDNIINREGKYIMEQNVVKGKFDNNNAKHSVDIKLDTRKPMNLYSTDQCQYLKAKDKIEQKVMKHKISNNIKNKPDPMQHINVNVTDQVQNVEDNLSMINSEVKPNKVIRQKENKVETKKSTNEPAAEKSQKVEENVEQKSVKWKVDKNDTTFSVDRKVDAKKTKKKSTDQSHSSDEKVSKSGAKAKIQQKESMVDNSEIHTVERKVDTRKPNKVPIINQTSIVDQKDNNIKPGVKTKITQNNYNSVKHTVESGPDTRKPKNVADNNQLRDVEQKDNISKLGDKTKFEQKVVKAKIYDHSAKHAVVRKVNENKPNNMPASDQTHNVDQKDKISKAGTKTKIEQQMCKDKFDDISVKHTVEIQVDTIKPNNVPVTDQKNNIIKKAAKTKIEQKVISKTFVDESAKHTIESNVDARNPNNVPATDQTRKLDQKENINKPVANTNIEQKNNSAKHTVVSKVDSKKPNNASVSDLTRNVDKKDNISKQGAKTKIEQKLVTAKCADNFAKHTVESQVDAKKPNNVSATVKSLNVEIKDNFNKQGRNPKIEQKVVTVTDNFAKHTVESKVDAKKPNNVLTDQTHNVEQKDNISKPGAKTKIEQKAVKEKFEDNLAKHSVESKVDVRKATNVPATDRSHVVVKTRTNVTPVVSPKSEKKLNDQNTKINKSQSNQTKSVSGEKYVSNVKVSPNTVKAAVVSKKSGSNKRALEEVADNSQIVSQDINKSYIKSIEQRMQSWLNAKYSIRGIIHKGYFSTIYKCEKATGAMYALKVIKSRFLSKSKYNEQLWLDVQKSNTQNSYFIVEMIKSFHVSDEFCFLTEYYPKTLAQALLESGTPFHINVVQILSRQLVEAVIALTESHIIHSDIKPQHILLNNRNDRLKLCGLDRADYDYHIRITPSSGTSSYRAPETILGYAANYGIDTWATALVMYEMATDITLFPGHYNNDILFKQQCTLGSIESDMLEKCAFKFKYFSGKLFMRQISREKKSLVQFFVTNNKLRHTLFSTYNQFWRCNAKAPWIIAQEMNQIDSLYDLLEQMLVMDPRYRLSIDLVARSHFLNVVPDNMI